MLTARQRECLDFIAGRIQETGGIPPSYREIGQALHLSHGNAHALVDRLIERGKLRRLAYKGRAIEVIPDRSTAYPPLVHYSNATYFTWDDEAKSLVPMERKR